jgi:hypothetical protein
MAMKPIDLTGGKSVYCFNESQIRSAHELAFEREDTAPRIQAELNRLETEMSRNERAALAFVMIDRLLKTPANE